MKDDEMTSEYEHRIRRALAGRAARIDARPDPVELTDRIAGRDRRRTRALSAALVLALFAGPTLGFVAGRNRGDDSTTTSAERGDGVTVASATPPGPESAESAQSAAVELGERTVVSGRRFRSWHPAPALTRAFVRDITLGERGDVRVRAFRGTYDTDQANGPSWWEPPGWCFPSGSVQADVSSDDAVGIVSGSIYPELREGVTGGMLEVIGVPEGAPMWVLIAQAPADAARVRATFPGGTTDEMEAVDGVAILLASASIEPETDYSTETASVEVFDAAGQSLGTGVRAGRGDAGTVRGRRVSGADGAPFARLGAAAGRRGCAPGRDRRGRRPRTRNDQPDDARMAAIDDPAGLPEVWEQNRNGQYAEQIANSVIAVDDVVFASPSTRSSSTTGTPRDTARTAASGKCGSSTGPGRSHGRRSVPTSSSRV